jgi:hypothetical protein
MLASLAPLGCAMTVQPGLANASALSTTPVADATVNDIVANGRDSCAREFGPGPLRDQIPACPAVEERRAGQPPVIGVAPPAIVIPWVEHYYSRWPCLLLENEASRLTLANPAALSVGERGLSLTCAGPL